VVDVRRVRLAHQRAGADPRAGVTLFLAGDAAFRVVLRTGTPRYRAAAAVTALAAWPVSVAADGAAGIALLTAVTAAALAAEGRAERAAGHATVEA
jgi:hypothetical protein